MPYYLVRTGLTLCSLLALSSVAHAEPGTETAVRDTSLNANCSLTDYGASGGLFIGKSGEYDLGTCGPGTGVTATNRQRPMVMFDLGEWIPGSLTNVVFDIYQEEFIIAVESASVCTSSQELIEGAVWDDEPICDNPRATRGAAAHYYLQNPLGAALPLAQGSTLATGALFEADLALSMGNGTGLVTLSIYSSYSNEIPETDHYASLESPVGIPATLIFDGVKKECDVDVDCDDADVCNGAEACDEYVCIDGTDAPDGTVCPTGECQAGTCVALQLDNPILDAVPECLDNPTNEAICEYVNNFCPCALPGGYGGALQSYSSPLSYWYCGFQGYFGAGGTWWNPLRSALDLAMRPGSELNNACWLVP